MTSERRGYALITGGAGFIGTNLAHHLLAEGRRVLLFDNLSRPGVERNLAWLKKTHGPLLDVDTADLRNARAVDAAVRGAEVIFHLGAQVAVTTSLADPRHDFAVNTAGTLNVLEAVRCRAEPPPVIFTSTNKVYGALPDVKLRESEMRYLPDSITLAANGVSEARGLDFHSPYGCSKGAADQYLLDYGRSYRLPTVVFRMSCIYGPHQLGTEDQGWVAHFLIRALEGRPITLYGDGKQVRDILWVGDLLRAFRLALEQIRTTAGHAFNIGGGVERSVSLLELVELIGVLHGGRPPLEQSPWRVGDQRYYVSDTRKFTAFTGWRPTVEIAEGLTELYQWLASARGQPRRQLFAEEVL